MGSSPDHSSETDDSSGFVAGNVGSDQFSNSGGGTRISRTHGFTVAPERGLVIVSTGPFSNETKRDSDLTPTTSVVRLNCAIARV